MSVYEATMPPQDPREQPVIDPWRATPESIAYAKHLAALERAQIDAIIKPLVHICGWCSNARELTEAAIARGEDVSHGICPACMERVDEEYARTSEAKLQLTWLVDKFGAATVQRWLANITAMQAKGAGL